MDAGNKALTSNILQVVSGAQGGDLAWRPAQYFGDPPTFWTSRISLCAAPCLAWATYINSFPPKRHPNGRGQLPIALAPSVGVLHGGDKEVGERDRLEQHVDAVPTWRIKELIFGGT
jgi:hypothetical protein